MVKLILNMGRQKGWGEWGLGHDSKQEVQDQMQQRVFLKGGVDISVLVSALQMPFFWHALYHILYSFYIVPVWTFSFSQSLMH